MDFFLISREPSYARSSISITAAPSYPISFKALTTPCLLYTSLLYRMLEGTEEVPGLRHIENVEVYVDMEDLTYKDLIVAMGIKGIEYSECVQKYLEHGVTVFERLRSSMYSKRIVEALGIEGAIRVSPLHCNSTEDIDEFLKITKKIAESV